MLQLVQGLLALCGRPECDRETTLEVSRCLGQVGPTDFRCIALSPNSNHSELESVMSYTNFPTASVCLLLDRDICL